MASCDLRTEHRRPATHQSQSTGLAIHGPRAQVAIGTAGKDTVVPNSNGQDVACTRDNMPDSERIQEEGLGNISQRWPGCRLRARQHARAKPRASIELQLKPHAPPHCLTCQWTCGQASTCTSDRMKNAQKLQTDASFRKVPAPRHPWQIML